MPIQDCHLCSLFCMENFQSFNNRQKNSNRVSPCSYSVVPEIHYINSKVADVINNKSFFSHVVGSIFKTEEVRRLIKHLSVAKPTFLSHLVTEAWVLFEVKQPVLWWCPSLPQTGSPQSKISYQAGKRKDSNNKSLPVGKEWESDSKYPS